MMLNIRKELLQVQRTLPIGKVDGSL